MKTANGKDIREVVDDPYWQALRLSLLGTWKTTPMQNVARLRRYLNDEQWGADVVARVLNYLTGTAFRIGAIDAPSITLLRDDVRRMHEKHKAKQGAKK
jgi:hypothetical protein